MKLEIKTTGKKASNFSQNFLWYISQIFLKHYFFFAPSNDVPCMLYCEVLLHGLVHDNVFLCVNRQDISHFVFCGSSSSFGNLFSGTICTFPSTY
jgi:hypothetical protein